MALKMLCPFSLQCVGDGVATSFNFLLSTAPIVLYSGTELQPTFNLSVLAPSGVNNVNSSNGIPTTLTLGLLGMVTITFATPPPNAAFFFVTGYFEF